MGAVVVCIGVGGQVVGNAKGGVVGVPVSWVAVIRGVAIEVAVVQGVAAGAAIGVAGGAAIGITGG